MLNITDKKNAIWNSLGFIGSSVLGFVNFSINYNSFSAADFGVFILINSIFGIGNALDFGFGVSTVKYISEARGIKDFELVNQIYVSFLILFGILALIIVGGFYAYFFTVFRYSELFINTDYKLLQIMFLFLSISFLFRYINNFLGKVFEGFSEFVLFSKVSLLASAINTIFMIVIFVFKLTIGHLAFAYMITGFITFLLLIIISLKEIDVLKLQIKYFSLTMIKKYAAYSINIQLSFLVGSFVDPVVKYLLGKYLNISFVTLFESAKKIIDLSNGLIFSAQKGLLNKLSENNVANKLNDYVNSNIFIYAKMSNYYSILIYGILNTFICSFVIIWFGSYESMIMLLIFFLPYSLINFSGCLYLVLMIEGKGIKLLIIQVINIIMVSLLLYLSLTISNNYIGIIGYYLATIVTMSVLFYFIIKFNDFDYKAFIKQVNVKDLLKLNLIIISEITFLYIYRNYYQYVLTAYTLVYFVAFYSYISYFYRTFYGKLRNILISR
ncbi:MAG: oligosaccharide flippase family protein [Ignavibacteria bacterium]